MNNKNIGKKVHIIIDRPLGTYHPKQQELYYPINYGYVEGIIAADGEEQDIYLLGVEEPVKDFDGVVIAVVHRKNDVEDKWVAVPAGVTFTAEEIQQATAFQEQYFESEIWM